MRARRVRWGRGWLTLLLLVAPDCRSNQKPDGGPAAALDGAGGRDAADASIEPVPSCVCGAASLAAIPLGGCTFQVPCTPADFSRFSVMVNGVPVPRDQTHANGWDYPDTAMTSFRLFGPPCDSVTNGTSTSVTVDELCAGP